MKRIRTFLIVVVVAWVLAFSVGQLAGIVINTSASMPVGLYIQDPNGPYIGFCPMDDYLSAARRYRHRALSGWSYSCADGAELLLKPVAAREGDTVVLDSAGIAVNGRRIPNSAALDRDSAGRPMSRWLFGKYVVEPGQVWAISSYDGRSYDSRYFGPVRITSVRERYRALLVVNE